MTESETSAHERVKSKFDQSRSSYISAGEEPEEASRHAIDQTLIPENLNKAGVNVGDLTREESEKSAQVLIDGFEPRVREIVEELKKGEAGDLAEQEDFSDSRILRILASAKRILNK